MDEALKLIVYTRSELMKHSPYSIGWHHWNKRVAGYTRVWRKNNTLKVIK